MWYSSFSGFIISAGRDFSWCRCRWSRISDGLLHCFSPCFRIIYRQKMFRTGMAGCMRSFAGVISSMHTCLRERIKGFNSGSCTASLRVYVLNPDTVCWPLCEDDESGSTGLCPVLCKRCFLYDSRICIWACPWPPRMDNQPFITPIMGIHPIYRHFLLRRRIHTSGCGTKGS